MSDVLQDLSLGVCYDITAVAGHDSGKRKASCLTGTGTAEGKDI